MLPWVSGRPARGPESSLESNPVVISRGQPAVPLDFLARPNSNLNADFINGNFEAWPDQEIVGLVTDGVQFKADAPLQVVLIPSLRSLALAPLEVERQTQALIDEGLFRAYDFLPLIPMRFNAIGKPPRAAASFAAPVTGQRPEARCATRRASQRRR